MFAAELAITLPDVAFLLQLLLLLAESAPFGTNSVSVGICEWRDLRLLNWTEAGSFT